MQFLYGNWIELVSPLCRRVHISKAAYDNLKGAFEVEPGKDLWRNGRNTPKNCIFWKYIVGGSSYYTPGLDGGWFFGPWAFIIPKCSYQDLSNEGSKKFFWVHWNLFFKLLKHGCFWLNFRFWLVWVELRKSKALSSLNFLQRHEKYPIWSCPQLLYA